MLKKYFIPFLYTLFIILVGSLFASVLYYFDITNNKFNMLLIYLVGIISIFTGSLMFCKNINQRGIIGGIIYFGICFIIMNFIGFIIFKSSFKINLIIYYLILLIFSIMGGIIGKNSKEIDTLN